jgi:hypothetical protein
MLAALVALSGVALPEQPPGVLLPSGTTALKSKPKDKADVMEIKEKDLEDKQKANEKKKEYYETKVKDALEKVKAEEKELRAAKKEGDAEKEKARLDKAKSLADYQQEKAEAAQAKAEEAEQKLQDEIAAIKEDIEANGAVAMGNNKSNIKYHGVYIPSSQCFFCICLKCGTTSLYQYIFGATHGQSWCDFAQKKLGKSETSVDGCETSLMEASLQSIGAMPLDVDNPYYDPDGLWNLPYVRAHGQESPLYDGAVDIETNKTVKAAPAADDDADDDGWYPGKLFGLPQPKGTSLRELTPMDASEYITKSYWGSVFKGKYGGNVKNMPPEVFQSAYKHAIVRDPVQRLISAWINKLSCGIYSVPSGRDGSLHAGREDQLMWGSVAEVSDKYAKNLKQVANAHVVKQTYKAPCHLSGMGNIDKSPCQRLKGGGGETKSNWTTASCNSVPIDKFADAMVNVYKMWSDPKFHHAGELNGHFAPQFGQGSCFQDVDPEEYDAVSTISDKAKMKAFSQHLPEHKLGLWGNQHSNMHSNLYFEGKKFTIPGSVISKLKKATEMEKKVLGKYL